METTAAPELDRIPGLNPQPEPKDSAARRATEAISSTCVDVAAEPPPCEYPPVENLPEHFAAEVVIAEGETFHAVGTVQEEGRSPSFSTMALHGGVAEGSWYWHVEKRWPRGEWPGLRDISSELFLVQKRGEPFEVVRRTDGATLSVGVESPHWAALMDGVVAYTFSRGSGTLELALTRTGTLDEPAGRSPQLLGEVAPRNTPVVWEHDLYFARSRPGEGHTDGCVPTMPFVTVMRARQQGKHIEEVSPLPGRVLELSGVSRHGQQETFLLGVESRADTCRQVAAPTEPREPPFIGAERPSGVDRSCIPSRDTDVALAVLDADGAHRVLRWGSETLDRPYSLVRGLAHSSYFVSWCALGPTKKMGEGNPHCYLARLEDVGTPSEAIHVCAAQGGPHRFVSTGSRVLAYASDSKKMSILESSGDK